LAERTQIATKDITVVVKSMQNETLKIEKNTEEINSIVAGTIPEIDELETKIGTFQRDANRSVFEIQDISDRIFVGLAITDHVVYKNNLYALIFGEENNNFKKVDHHNCRLGKWYEQGLGKEQFSKTKSYKELEIPHSIVHKEGNELAELCGVGDSTSCSVLFIEEKVQKIENASTDVFKVLENMVEEKTTQIMHEAKDKLFNDSKPKKSENKLNKNNITKPTKVENLLNRNENKQNKPKK
jgi:hypothetical protein